MARFFFLDQSLKGLGGHHFDYATHVAKAAVGAGYEVFLIPHQSLRQAEAFADEIQVVPLFRNTTYNHYSLFSPKDAGIPKTAIQLQRTCLICFNMVPQTKS